MTCGECGNVTAPGAGFPNHVYCKRFLLNMGKREDASRCRDFIPKPTTNADRIRSMTDEELAIFLANLASCPECNARIKDCGINCLEAWLDWLKEEVYTDGN